MLLILSNSSDATVDFLEKQLKLENIDWVRIDTDSLIDRAEFSYSGAFPTLTIDRRDFGPSDISQLWYRRPKRICHESHSDEGDGRFLFDEWSESLEGFLAHIEKHRWMNHPSNNAFAGNKIRQLTLARELGAITPRTLVTQSPSDATKFLSGLPGSAIVKPLSCGFIERDDGSDSVLYTNEVTADSLQRLELLSECPTLFQERIEKVSDIRVTVVDESVHAVELIATEEDGRQRCDIRRRNMEDVEYRAVNLPSDVFDFVRNAMDQLQLRFAALDFVVRLDGRWVFLEVNPNGQWAWLDQAGASNIASSFLRSFSQKR